MLGFEWFKTDAEFANGFSFASFQENFTAKIMIRQISFNADRLMRGNYRYQCQSYVGWTFSIIAFFLKWSEYNFNWFFDVVDVIGRFADVDVFIFREKKKSPKRKSVFRF